MCRIINRILLLFNRSKKTKDYKENFNEKKNTALHEAAHIVTAYLSEYHSIVGRICITSNSTAITFVTLSKSKLKSTGKETIQSNFENDPEIATDIAVILYSGYEAEKKYSQITGFQPSMNFSMNDYNEANRLLEITNQSNHIDFLKETSMLLVDKYWEPIVDIANLILNSDDDCLEAYIAIDFLDRGFKNN